MLTLPLLTSENCHSNTSTITPFEKYKHQNKISSVVIVYVYMCAKNITKNFLEFLYE